MKKSILALAIAMMGCTAFSVSAQSQDTQTTDTETQAKQDKMYRPQKFTDFAFEGVLLDINQQARMDSLNAAVKAQAPNREEGGNPENREGRDRGPGQDSRRDRREPRGGQHQMMPFTEDYVYKVKEILTPEQYTTFLENIVLMPYKQGAPGNQAAPRR